MTWAEFKAQVERQCVKDSDDIEMLNEIGVDSVFCEVNLTQGLVRIWTASDDLSDWGDDPRYFPCDGMKLKNTTRGPTPPPPAPAP